MAQDTRYRRLGDGALVAACQKGDESAWDELLRRHGGLIFSTARRMGLSPLDAQDIFQNVAIRLLENLSSLREPERVTAWLLAVTRRETLRWLQRQRPTSPMPDEALDATLEAELVVLLDRHVLEQTLAQLPERCQQLLRALYLDENEPSYEEIAQTYGWAVGSVGPNRARCLERLQKLLPPHAEK